jgi:hypothetical protein
VSNGSIPCTLLLFPNLKIPASQQVRLFIQYLYNKSLRSTLVTYIDIKEIREVDLVIKKAISLEEGARLAEEEVNDQVQNDTRKDDPMAIDFMQQKKYQGKKNVFKRPKNKKGYNQASEPPKLYDKHGNPVCEYCQGHHRNYECKQNTNGKHNKYQITQVETETKNNNDLVELQSIKAKQVNYITYSKSVTPITVIKLGSNSIIAL